MMKRAHWTGILALLAAATLVVGCGKGADEEQLRPGTTGADRGAGTTGADRLTGTTGADRLTGTTGADRRTGTTGADRAAAGAARALSASASGVKSGSTAADAAVVERFVGVFERVATAAAGQGKDCDRIAEAVETVVSDGQKTIRAMHDSADGVALRRRFQQLDSRFSSRLKAAMKKLEPALEACPDHARLSSALEAVQL